MVFQGNICRNFGPVMFFVLFEFKIWLLDISVYKNNGLTWYRNLDLIVGMVIGWGCEVITSCSSYQRCGRWRTSKFLLWDVTLAGEFFPPRIFLLFLWSLALPEAQGFDLTVYHICSLYWLLLQVLWERSSSIELQFRSISYLEFSYI